MAKRKAAGKKSDELTRGQKVAKTRKELGGIRARIRDMNSVQLSGFFGGFNDREMKAIERAITKAKRDKAAVKIRKLEAERDRINEQIAALND
jgi:predicted  nucleic acid-binding Zn-ribbon protein